MATLIDVKKFLTALSILSFAFLEAINNIGTSNIFNKGTFPKYTCQCRVLAEDVPLSSPCPGPGATNETREYAYLWLPSSRRPWSRPS